MIWCSHCKELYLDDMVREGYVRVKNGCACSEASPTPTKGHERHIDGQSS